VLLTVGASYLISRIAIESTSLVWSRQQVGEALPKQKASVTSPIKQRSLAGKQTKKEKSPKKLSPTAKFELDLVTSRV